MKFICQKGINRTKVFKDFKFFERFKIKFRSLLATFEPQEYVVAKIVAKNIPVLSGPLVKKKTMHVFKLALRNPSLEEKFFLSFFETWRSIVKTIAKVFLWSTFADLFHVRI